MDNFQFNDADELPQEDIEFIDVSDEMPLVNGKHSKRAIWLSIAGVLLLLLAAVVVGGRMLGISIDPGGPEIIRMGDGRSMTTYSDSNMPEIEYDERYPKTDPDISGIFTRREDNSLFIGTGRITMMASMKEGSDKVDLKGSYDGPLYEVLVTGDTKIYIDYTYGDGIDIDRLSKMDTIQQVLEESASLDGIGENTTLKVWGRRSGDRFIADTLIYTAPLTIVVK